MQNTSDDLKLENNIIKEYMSKLIIKVLVYVQNNETASSNGDNSKKWDILFLLICILERMLHSFPQ
jgi:hypothetical protein